MKKLPTSDVKFEVSNYRQSNTFSYSHYMCSLYLDKFRFNVEILTKNNSVIDITLTTLNYKEDPPKILLPYFVVTNLKTLLAESLAEKILESKNVNSIEVTLFDWGKL